MSDEQTIVQGEGPLTLLLAHGAGAPMDTFFMEELAKGLSAEAMRVVRFEFGYMQRRREDGKKRPPSSQKVLEQQFMALIREWSGRGPLLIGGKSMGGRIASTLVGQSEVVEAGVQGCLCFGYPFHPPGKPDRWKTAHLSERHAPILVCQGTRDPFGKHEEVQAHLSRLEGPPEIVWLEAGDHDFKPTKKSGLSQSALIAQAAFAAGRWVNNDFQLEEG